VNCTQAFVFLQFQDWLCNLEIGTQFLDSENAQCNLEIAQIPRLDGTYTSQEHLHKMISEAESLNDAPMAPSFTFYTQCGNLDMSVFQISLVIGLASLSGSPIHKHKMFHTCTASNKAKWWPGNKATSSRVGETCLSCAEHK